MARPELSERRLKGELRISTRNYVAGRSSNGDGKRISALFFVLDGGNGYFYIYAECEKDPHLVGWKEVLESDIVAEGTFAEIIETHRMIREGALGDGDLDEPYRVRMETGELRRLDFGDRALNRFLATLAQEVITEVASAAQHRSVWHSEGCNVYFSDVDVLGHEEYTQCRVPA
jgi:hypothetical protein